MRGISRAATAFAIGLTATAASAETTSPWEGNIDLEFGIDSTFRADDPDARLTDTFGSAAFALRLRMTDGIALNFGATAEAVLDPRPATDRTFGDIGLYIDTLNLEAEIGPVTLTAGKFGAGFGTAWDTMPGIWSADLAEDYELAEQLGVGLSWDLGATPLGSLTLGVNLFTADTTTLSDSALTRRGRLTRADGGAGNTGRLNNVSLTLDGSDLEAAPGLSWHLGYRQLKPGIGDIASERGMVFGLAQTFELGNGTELTVAGEVARLRNAGGSADDADHATLGLGLARGAWHGELAASSRRLTLGAGGSARDTLVQISGGYTWDNGIDLSLGYGRFSEAGSRSEIIGLRLTRSFSF
ncbi:hypothetical protein HOY34_07355 [Xinfangfangia sp. D13-10-4-6]|uniref:hypothetical protein n=1 Tax=Pseudogemmobacter hezensis TaxID=2737662 RepID=UPI00155806B4|nr:hypothetical protein [Pseudogemmobacter hezensis]NPD15020.1 hypothetical protein [Pseudogemmobacter hezensis]